MIIETVERFKRPIRVTSMLESTYYSRERRRSSIKEVVTIAEIRWTRRDRTRWDESPQWRLTSAFVTGTVPEGPRTMTCLMKDVWFLLWNTGLTDHSTFRCDVDASRAPSYKFESTALSKGSMNQLPRAYSQLGEPVQYFFPFCEDDKGNWTCISGYSVIEAG